MENNYLKLADIPTGEECVIVKVHGHGSFRNRIVEMGFVRGEKVTVIKNAPLHDPIEYKLMDGHISLRRSEARLIEVVCTSSIDQEGYNGTFTEDEIAREISEKSRTINIALVGKYDLQDAYKSIREALSQAGTYNDRKVEVHFVNSEKLTDENVGEALKGMAGVMIGPGFGQRGIDGKFVAIKYTRTHDIPTFGICLGMQCIAIEFARNVLGFADANSREMDEKTPHNVIDIMEEQKAITNMGGTMRLGAYECVLQKGSKAYQAYGQEHIQERHRHRYEFNNDFKDRYEAAGMKCVGINPESDLVEIVEIPTLKWFVGTQFHPEYGSTVLNPHPLFVAFVKAAIENEKATVNG